MEGKEKGLSSMLRLIMEKGPLEGQTLEFVPGSKIRIGRIVRGNTVAIKDAGISTKHLAISSSVESGTWTLSDLGSSNGTVLNGNYLEPFSVVQLSDGDGIKVGEYTSIKVEVGNKVEAKAEAEESKVRRNPPRRKGGKLGVVNGSSELGFRTKNENKENGQGQIGKEMGALESSEVSGSLDLIDGDNKKVEILERKEKLRRTRSKNKEGLLEDKIGLENFEGDENVRGYEAMKRLRPRRGRDAKKGDVIGGCADAEHSVADELEGKQGQEQSLKRIARSKRKGGNSESKEIEKVLLYPMVKDEENVRVSRTNRSAVKEENVVNLEGLGDKNIKKGRRGRTNLKVATLIETVEEEIVKGVETMDILDLVEEKDSLGKEVLEEEPHRVVDGMLEKGRNYDLKDSGALLSVSVVEDDNASELDLEKITLGDWLEYLEAHLPKKIVDATEEMISGMRQKAEKFHEFMMQQKNTKRQG